MRYSDITTGDRNRLKAWLQERRHDDALAIGEPRSSCTVLDYGAGNGELCRRLASRRAHERILCFEPASYLREEARENLASVDCVELLASLESIPDGSVGLLFCNEVLEHLPPEPTRGLLADVERLLAPDGTAVIGVPVELGVPALYKGLFRMSRRIGEFDAVPLNILRCTLGMPPSRRPVEDIAPGLPYHFHHLGFDHRRLRRQLAEKFEIRREVASPFRALRTWFNPEVYFVLGKRGT